MATEPSGAGSEEEPSRIDPELAAAVLDAFPEAVGVLDEHAVMQLVAGNNEHLAYPRSDMQGRSPIDFVDPAWMARAAEGIGEVLQGRATGRPVRLVMRRADGEAIPVDILAKNCLDDPRIRGIITRGRDATGPALLDEFLTRMAHGSSLESTLEPALALVELELAPAACSLHLDDGSERFARALVGPQSELLGSLAHGEETAEDLAVSFGAGVPEGRATRSPAAVESGAETSAIVLDPLDVLPGRLAAAARAGGFVQRWTVPIVRPGSDQVEAVLAVWRTDEEEPWAMHRNALDRLVHLLAMAIHQDRTTRQLVHAAAHDVLTDLPNRATFYGHLDERVKRREGGVGDVAVLYVDLDGFKAVNDELGHQAGDELLRVIARRLERAIRPGDVVARLGGDEFAVLCPHVGHRDEASAVADRLIAGVSEPVVLGGERITVGASIGICLGGAATSADSLVRQADAALYEVKRAGRGAWRFAASG